MRRADREVLDKSEIEEIIRRSDVCRIALSDGLLPYIVTMNFGFKSENGRVLYFHCASQGKKIEMIKVNNNVCFQMDTDHILLKGESACDFGMSYSSIIGWGKIIIVNDEAERKRGLDCIMNHYTTDTDLSYIPSVFERTTILRLDISELTCKKK